MNSLTCSCVPRLDGVSAAERGRLFFKHRHPAIDRFLMAWPAVSEKILSRLGFWPVASPASPGVPTRDRQEPPQVRRLDPTAQAE